MLIVQTLHVRVHEMPCRQKQFKHLHNSLKACDSKLPQVADWCCDETQRTHVFAFSQNRTSSIIHLVLYWSSRIIHIIFFWGGGSCLVVFSLSLMIYHLFSISGCTYCAIYCFPLFCLFCSTKLFLFLCASVSLHYTKHTIQGK